MLQFVQCTGVPSGNIQKINQKENAMSYPKKKKMPKPPKKKGY
jgi:hypothetical protein